MPPYTAGETPATTILSPSVASRRFPSDTPTLNVGVHVGCAEGEVSTFAHPPSL